ncbi:putative ribonuclease H-like domain-containing protein [Tanacetum coccineum]
MKVTEGFFIRYSINSKAFRVYNIRTRKVEENLHVRFLEDKPIIAGDGPKWLFDIDVLTKSMNYVLVVTGTNSNDSVDGSLFDSSSKNANNDEPQPSNDVGKKDDEGGIDNQERPKKSAQDVNTVGPSINTDSTNFNTGSLNINIGSPTVPTAPLEAIHDDFFGDEIELDMSNISTTYPVPSTPNTRIHKDHSLDNVIGEVQYSEEPKKGKRAIGTKWVYRNKKDERAYASFKDFVVYQMDVKSAFLYGKIKEEVYVCQLSRFKDPESPDKVYKVEKTLYGLHQAPRAWIKGDILLVQVYVNDIIFGSTKKVLCTEFEKLRHMKFQMISMGEITFFLRLQVTQKDDGIFISQDKSMIGSLMYLTASRPDILFVDSQFDLEAYTDNDYASASLDMKSTTGVKNLLFHSKTKHIEIRHHFIRDSNKKKLIQMIKIHIDHNVADLLTKAFDVGRFYISLQAMKCLTSEVLIEGRLTVLICSGFYTNAA